jgi:hypothetical protein
MKPRDKFRAGKRLWREAKSVWVYELRAQLQQATA